MAKLNRFFPPVNTGHFSMVPRSDVPRSTFATQHSVKMAFQSSYLVPVHVDEVLPGDVHRGEMFVFARLATQIFPIMDNAYIESFFFFVPARILWSNWVKFMGEQDNPGDSIAYTVPYTSVAAIVANTLYDYMGIPPTGQMVNTIRVNALPFRAYYRIWNEWFRDENLQNSLTEAVNDGPDAFSYLLQKRNKKHDYFTSALPWPQKGGATALPFLQGQAWVKTQSTDLLFGAQPGLRMKETAAGVSTDATIRPVTIQSSGVGYNAAGTASGGTTLYPSNLYADLSTATGATINTLRQAVTLQQFLEKDARGGTRYTELLQNHFGVHPQDARLQRPEYIGGGKSPVQVQSIGVTSSTNITGATLPTGNLAGAAVAAGRHEFSYHASEHGYIIGLVNLCADLTYQQGVHRLWTRQTRYDFYWPVFANLGEQVVYNHEIFAIGSATSKFPTDPAEQDGQIFGYQERWAEYRHRPSRVAGVFRSTTASNIDEWHLGIQFSALPVLNSSFIEEATPFSRVLAAGAGADNQQVLFDSVFNIRCTRAMPKYSVPGLVRF